MSVHVLPDPRYKEFMFDNDATDNFQLGKRRTLARVVGKSINAHIWVMWDTLSRVKGEKDDFGARSRVHEPASKYVSDRSQEHP